jgi:hypothetical protein
VRDSEAVPGLLESLDFIPLRPRLAEALGRIGDTKARAPLLSLFRKERYETARPAEARALAVLGAGADLAGPLAMFAGLADPMNEAVTVARDAGILDPRRGGIRVEPPQQDVAARLSVKGLQRPWRLWVLEGAEGGELSGTVGPWPVRGAAASGSTYRVDLDPGPESAELGDIQVHLHDPKGISAVWLVTRWLETPPPRVLPLPDAGHDSARHAP